MVSVGGILAARWMPHSECLYPSGRWVMSQNSKRIPAVVKVGGILAAWDASHKPRQWDEPIENGREMIRRCLMTEKSVRILVLVLGFSDKARQ